MNHQFYLSRLVCSMLSLAVAVCLTGANTIYAQGIVTEPGVPEKILGVVPNAGANPLVKAWGLSQVTGFSNVKVYGAVGDGMTDDTAAIQAALDDVDAKVVYFPKGTYRISSALVISRTGVRIVGQSLTSAVIQQVTSDQNAFELGAGQVNRCSFEQLKILGTGLASSTGAAFHMKSQTAGVASSRHRWQDVQVIGFNQGWHAFQIPLATWVSCQANNCLVGWLLDRCDTPLLVGCGSQASAAGSTEACVRSINGGFSGQIINGEWGNSKRAFDFQRGIWQVIGGNIEANTADGVIFVGPGATLDIRKLRISLPSPAVAGSAVVVLSAPGGIPPQLTLGDISWDAQNWKHVAVRGSRYFQARPRIDAAERNTKIYYESAVGGQTYYSGYASNFPIWPATEWLFSVANSEASNRDRRGVIAMFAVNDDMTAQFEQPVAFVRTRWGTHQRSSLLNDRLMDVLTTQANRVGNTGTSGNTETELFNVPILRHTHQKDGDLVTLRSSGKAASNDNLKRLKVYFGGYKVFDSNSKAWNGRAFDLEARVSRRAYNRWVVSTTLLVDNQLPMVKSYLGTTSLNYDTALRLTATGGAVDDIVVEYSDAVWRKSDADD